ncbi:hypothetical protein G7K_3931-t1 [Saitoella complicata NRRL Y-17804]|uniref:Uncharacterized protein n=1 Tax=Saitoella complicata (strain BCRC 22490 / CBS 7301 / JCM 7358 / NBRC 10748 / NRRL Y-17804) TaxID=698492 RepID=A0A0E9NIW7_SAICN|nr:hypothetical protein G7K_3931-t1 [Saitoella complicata NRRL Y-17804]
MSVEPFYDELMMLATGANISQILCFDNLLPWGLGFVVITRNPVSCSREGRQQLVWYHSCARLFNDHYAYAALHVPLPVTQKADTLSPEIVSKSP